MRTVRTVEAHRAHILTKLRLSTRAELVRYAIDTGLLDEPMVATIEEIGLQGVRIRSPLICEAEQGVCATCYGRDLARGLQRRGHHPAQRQQDE